MQSEQPVVADVPTMMGGKKRRSNKNKKGGAIDVGSVLAPVVLYGLRRSLKSKKQQGGAPFSSNPSPIDVSTGPLLVGGLPVVAQAGVAVVPPSVEQVAVPQEAHAVPTDSGNPSLAGGAKKSRKGKKGPMAEGRVAVYGKLKAWGGDKKDDDDKEEQDGGKKKRRNKKGGDKKDDDDKEEQDGGKKKRRNNKKGGDKKDDDDKEEQDGGKKKRRNKKVKGGALDLYAEQLGQISASLNDLLFK